MQCLSIPVDPLNAVGFMIGNQVARLIAPGGEGQARRKTARANLGEVKNKTTTNHKRPMKTYDIPVRSSAKARQMTTYLAAGATVGILALAASGLVGRAHADADPNGAEDMADIRSKAQLYELDQLEVQFHKAGSYGGDIEAMMALWADDCTLTSGGVTLSGKDAVRAAFASGGPFKHYWVGLTAAFKITAETHGDTAEIYFECHYADPSVTPYELRADRSLYGTVKKVNGKWLFWHMYGDAAPL